MQIHQRCASKIKQLREQHSTKMAISSLLYFQYNVAFKVQGWRQRNIKRRSKADSSALSVEN